MPREGNSFVTTKYLQDVHAVCIIGRVSSIIPRRKLSCGIEVVVSPLMITSARQSPTRFESSFFYFTPVFPPFPTFATYFSPVETSQRASN